MNYDLVHCNILHMTQLNSLILTPHLQIIPQSVCSRHGLAIGATVAPFVRVLVWICSPVAWPISKVIKKKHTAMSSCPVYCTNLFIVALYIITATGLSTWSWSCSTFP